MAQLVITAKREDNSQPWLEITDSVLSTLPANQISVLETSKSTLSSVPGYQTTSIDFPDDLTMVITHTFDTTSNAQNSELLFTQSPENTIFNEREIILQALRQQANVNYTFTRTII